MGKFAEIKIYRSNQQLTWLLVIHGLALVLLFSLSVSLLVQLLLSSCVLFGGVRLVRQWRKRIDLRLVYRDQRWFIGDWGELEEVELRSWCSYGRLVVLGFKRRKSLVLFPDALDDSSYSLLQQKLRFT